MSKTKDILAIPGVSGGGKNNGAGLAEGGSGF
jgi:hypothetical protein